MKPVILHISNDFPDPLKPDKTWAIHNLIEATPEYRHVVYSLNRVNGWGGLATIPFGEDSIAISYGALPKGLFWHRRLTQLAEWLYADIQAKQIVPTIVQAHKVTVEGIIGYVLARRFGCPLVCDIQGGTDVRVLKAKPNLRAHYHDIVKRSALIFSYAPWCLEPFKRLASMDEKKCVLLPVLPGFDTLSPSASRHSERLVTLMRFDDRKNKNLHGTLAAMRKLADEYPDLALDVYGGGDPKGLLELTAYTKKLGLAGRVHFKGSIDNKSLPEILGGYAALIMPSFMETYGLVYAEALFCGLPVIYSAGRAIDGYFSAKQIGYACNPANVDDIATAIDYVLSNEDTLKNTIADMQANRELDPIRRHAILETYRSHINHVIASR